MTKVVQTAGRDALGTFAPQFAALNDDVLFGEVWSNDNLTLKMRSILTVTTLVAKGMADASFEHHLATAKKNGVTREELAAMAERLLGPLLQPEHQALLDTLICYLDHNGNAKATAQAMFLHPNTLHYRLRKIQSLLHRDLGQSEDFFQVMLGRKLYDFITKN